MEKKYTKNPEKSYINLRHLPPIDPQTITTNSSLAKPSDAPVSKVIRASPLEETSLAEDDKAVATPNSAHTTQPHVLRTQSTSFGSRRGHNRRNKTKKNRPSPTDSTLESTDRSQVSGTPNQGSAKSHLYEICTAKKWKSPLFECCKEEGPSHLRMFTFKVVIEIREASNTILECFSAPQPKKKSAVEHAAEGALWYLKHIGYSSKVCK